MITILSSTAPVGVLINKKQTKKERNKVRKKQRKTKKEESTAVFIKAVRPSDIPVGRPNKRYTSAPKNWTILKFVTRVYDDTKKAILSICSMHYLE